MNKLGLYTVLGAFAFGSPLLVSGQEIERKDSLESETVVIRQEYEPVIKNAKKMNTQPVIQQVEKNSEEFKYDMVPQNTDYSFTPDTIQAVRIKGTSLNKLRRGYAKLGMGNYLNNYANLSLHSLRTRSLQWGLDVYHFASDGGIQNLPYNGFSNQDASAFGRKMLKHHIVDAEFRYNRQRVYMYGFNPELNFLPEAIIKDDIAQTYQLMQGRAGIKSFYADSNVLNYDLGVNYHFLSIDPGTTTESNLLIESQFSRFYGTEKGLLYFDIDYNKPFADSNDLNKIYSGNTLIKPGVDVQFMGDKWFLNAGFRMTLEIEDGSSFYFFPNVEFKYNVVRNLIVPYVGASGGIDRNSFNSLRQQNPYMSSLSDLKNTRTAYDAYIGVRGVITSSLSYNISGGYKAMKDMVLFVADSLAYHPAGGAENVYRPIYDTVNVAYVTAQLGYSKSEKWDVLWRLTYNSYETQNEVKAWNLPDFTSDVTVRYNMKNKIIVKSSVNFLSSRYVKTNLIEGAEELALNTYGRKLDPVIDFNLGFEYRFTPRISAFLDVNNILSQNYEIWGNYKVQGINVLGGVTFDFWKK